MKTGYRILICEPDAKSRRAQKASFGVNTGNFVWCNNSAEAIEFLDEENIDAAVICPAAKHSLLEVFDWIDQSACDIPVLIATQNNAMEMRILGLERGAVDYLIKPFDLNELLVRVTTTLYRRSGMRGFCALRGGLKLDMETGHLGNGAKWIALTPKERQALSLLIECGDQPVSRNRLKEAIANGKRVTDNALEVVIYRLRAKASQWGMNIRTYRGSGYVLEYQ